MKFALGILLFVVLITSCEDNEKKYQKPVNWTKDKSIEFGKSLAKEEEIMVKLFLKQRPEWKTTATGTGLHYWVYESHGNEKPVEGQKVEVILEVRLLDDSVCYQTDEGMVNTFLVDKSDIESGVQEGIKYLGVGDKAKLIIPSHLGHGLVGDLDKIPPLQVLIVDIELVNIL